MIADKNSNIKKISLSFFAFYIPIFKICINLRPIFIKFSGGEGGIRTHVRAFGPQVDFESTPLRPLRYLSGIPEIKTFSPQRAQRTLRFNPIKTQESKGPQNAINEFFSLES
jgi:hypothetical protein